MFLQQETLADTKTLLTLRSSLLPQSGDNGHLPLLEKLQVWI